MPENQIQAGSSVESLCRKCKTLTDHHVVVMDGEIIAKVQCKICQGRHAYKPPMPEPGIRSQTVPRSKKAPAASTASVGQPAPARSAAASNRKAAVTARQAQALAEEWEKLITLGASPNPYAMDAAFRVGEVIDHPVFGLGFVQRVMRPNTMEVRFRDAVRNMRCAVVGG